MENIKQKGKLDFPSSYEDKNVDGLLYNVLVDIL